MTSSRHSNFEQLEKQRVYAFHQGITGNTGASSTLQLFKLGLFKPRAYNSFNFYSITMLTSQDVYPSRYGFSYYGL